MARWSREGRAVYEAEREALLYDFLFFLTVQGVPIRQQIIRMKEGVGDFFFLFNVFGFIFIVLRCASVPWCYFSFVQQYLQQACQKRKRITLPRVCTYVRTACERA